MEIHTIPSGTAAATLIVRGLTRHGVGITTRIMIIIATAAAAAIGTAAIHVCTPRN